MKKNLIGAVLAVGLLFSASAMPLTTEAASPAVNPYAPFVIHDNNNLYDMVTVSILQKNKDLINDPFQQLKNGGNGGYTFNDYSKGLSKTSYPTFITQLPTFLKSDFMKNTWYYLNFSSHIEYKDSKKTTIETASISFDYFYRFNDVQYDVFTILNNGKYGVTFTRSQTDFDLLKHPNWFTNSTNNINFDQIFKDLNQSSILAPSSQVQTMLNGQKILTMKIINDGMVESATSKVYASPSSKAKNLGTLKKDNSVEIVALKSGWLEVIYGNSYGWILANTVMQGPGRNE